MKYLIPICFIVLFCRCGKDEVFPDCSALERYERCEREEDGCIYTIAIYKWKGETYYGVGSWLIEWVGPHLILDCAGNPLCDSNISGDCNEFFEEAVRVETVDAKVR